MTVARSQLVDPEVTPYYQCISRCVRRALLCGGQFAHCKDWIENRFQELAGIFAVEVCGYVVLDNIGTSCCGWNRNERPGWSDEEMVWRWGRLYPPRGNDRQPLPVTWAWVQQKLANTKWVAQARERLGTLGRFPRQSRSVDAGRLIVWHIER